MKRKRIKIKIDEKIRRVGRVKKGKRQRRNVKLKNEKKKDRIKKKRK